MPRLMRVAAVLLTGAILLAGCSTAPAATDEQGPEPDVVGDPGDYGYLDGPNATDRPHVHDYWNGATHHVAYEGEFTVGDTIPISGQRTYSVTHEDPTAVVWPGTRWVNITVTWSTDSPYGETMELSWRSNNETKSGRDVLKSGEPHSINTTEDMNDLPHAQTTRWQLMLMYDDGGRVEEGGVVGYGASGTVRIEIARPEGPLPLAPPHPDFWGSASTLVLNDTRGDLRDGVPVGESSRPPEDTEFDLAPGIVPPLTERLRVTLWYNSSTEPALHYDPVLRWMGADVHSREWDREPTEEERRREDGLFMWELEVEPNMWDSPYDNRTRWFITPQWQDWVAQPVPEPAHMDGDFHYQVSVHRDP